VALAPGNVATRHNLGNALSATGRMPEAIEQYKAVLAVQPGDSAVHRAIGLVYAAAGDRAQAASHIAEAVRLAPGDVEGQLEILGTLQQLGLLGAFPLPPVLFETATSVGSFRPRGGRTTSSSAPLPRRMPR
jgi:predicted Zn-dependent protease